MSEPTNSPGDTPTPTKRVEAAIIKADRCMNHDGAMKVFSPLVRDLASELAAAIAQVEELRRERDEQTELIAKGTEAMGAIRFVAGFLGLAGPTWSEEPGFAEKFTEAFLEQHRQLAEDRARLDWALENAISITVHNPRHAGMALVIIPSRESIDAAKGGQE